MPYTPEQRRQLHTKQSRLQVSLGEPSLNELTEGIPVLRSTAEGLVEYIRYKKEIFKKVLDRVGEISEEDVPSHTHPEITKDKNIFTNSVKVSQSGGSAGDLLHFRDETDKRDLVVRYNGEAYEYRTEIGGAGNVLMTFEDGGNVGIGTTTPDTALHILSSSDTTLKIDSSNDTNDAVILLQVTILLDGLYIMKVILTN